MPELAELVRAIQELAPEVWRITLKQVYVEIALSILWFLGLLGATMATSIGSVKLWRAHQKAGDRWDDKDMGAFLLGVVAICLGIGVFIALDATISRVINPEWRAIQLLRSLLPQ